MDRTPEEGIIIAKDAEIAALRAALAAMEAALRQYGKHGPYCPRGTTALPCSCGLDKALSSGGAEGGAR